MDRSREARSLLLAVTLAMLIGALSEGSAWAATISVPCDTTSLIAAITTANANGGADTLQLATGCAYDLTAVNNDVFTGPNGLPVITSEITIEGNGATIQRDAAAPDFRILEVASGGTLTLHDVTVRNGNVPSRMGGGIYNNGGTLTVTSSTLSGNSAANGGGLANDGGTLTIASSTLSSNSAPDTGLGGGAIYNDSGTVAVTSSALSGNSVPHAGLGGGGILNSGGTLTITGSTLSGNSAQGADGGGIYNNGGTVTVTNSTLSGNWADDDGGGIYTRFGPLTVTNSTLNGNFADRGGGIANSHTLTVTSSTLSANAANTNGGGGIYTTGGAVTVTSSTISTKSPFFGGGGGVRNSGGTVNLRATILDTGSHGPNCAGTITSQGSNLSDEMSCAGSFTQPGDQNNVSLLLGTLAINGGPTQTLALLDGSPAIDAVQGPCTSDGTGGGTAITADQRGVSRPKDGNADGTAACDAGAFEAPSHGRLQFSAATASVNENAGPAAVSVTRINGSEGAIGATVSTGDGTATQLADYTAVSATVSFGDGVTAGQVVNIPIVDDGLDEPDETVNLTLSNPTGGAVLGAPSAATLTIADDDPMPTLAIGDLTLAEGNGGSTSFVFTVTLTGPTSQTVTVQAQAADGTATAGSDYTATGPTVLTFTPGTTSQSFTVPALGDTLNEPNETFVVNLTVPTNATIARSQGIGTITDDDALTVSIDDQTVIEGNVGTSNAVFHITLSRASNQTITLQAQTAAATATAGQDYTATGPTTLTFAPGTTSQTFTVPAIADTVDEQNETFLVNLSGLTGPTSASIARVQGTGTILDDDGAPALSVSDVSLAEGNSGTTSFVFTVSLLPASAQQVTVVAQTADGTATAGSDYTPTGPTTLTFPPGTTTQTFSVPIVGDTTFEANETFVVNLSGQVHATVGKGQGIGTIANDDAAITCTPRPAVAVTTAKEGDGRLRVMVAADTQPPNGANRLSELRFQAGTNGLIDVAGQSGRSGSFSVPLTDSPSSVTFYVRRAIPGQATTVPFEAVDSCGVWRTFVGGGPSAF